MDNSNTLREWTIMIYMNVEPEGFEISFKKNIQEMSLVGSTDKVNIIIIADQIAIKPRIYKIEKNIEITPDTENFFELETEQLGSVGALKEFLKYCKDHHGAKKYMLSFWDHGAGVAVSASPDANTTHPNDGPQNYLYTIEIDTAIKNIFGKIDIVAFDACWMQMLENAYSLKDCADYLVASQNLASLQGFGYYFFFKYLINSPEISSLETAKLLIKSCYLKVSDNVEANSAEELAKLYYQKIYDDKTFTLSCIQLNQVKKLVDLINKLTTEFLNNRDILFPYIRIARFLCLSYFDEEDPPNYDLKTIDFVYFLKKLLDTKYEPEDEDAFLATKNLSYEIIEYVEMSLITYKEIGSSILEENPTEKRWGAHGFSIFFPEHPFEWELYQQKEGWYFEESENIKMPFAQENWKNFLIHYFDFVRSVL